IQAVVLLHNEREVALFVDRLELQRPADVALGVRRALLELPELVAIALRRANVSSALEDQELVLDFLVHPEAVQDPAMDDEIVAFAVWQVAVTGFEDTGAFAH